jgi:hypothetical protein
MVRLRYVRRKRGNLFWEPTPAMREMGFFPKPLGPEGPNSIAEATKLYEAWQQALKSRGKVTDYPAGSFGAFYDRFKRSPKWAKKALRTREDYDRAWKHVEPVFARKLVTSITPADCEGFIEDLGAKVSASERYRTVKCLRALFAEAIKRLQLVNWPNPALIAANPQPRGRSAIWLGAEIEALATGAVKAGYPGMAAAIRIAWDTLLSPVDVWTLTRSQVRQDGQGWYVATERAKTGKTALGALSEGTAAALWAYIEGLGVTIPSEGRLIRQRNGQAYRSKDTFGDDFRAVRKAVFPGDTRQFLDIRRSGNVEADAAGADKATMGELLANGLADSRFLDETYTPPTVTKAREVAQKRLEGRRMLAGEAMRMRSNLPPKA